MQRPHPNPWRKSIVWWKPFSLVLKNSPIVLLPAVVLFLLVIKKVMLPTLFTSGIVALLVGIFYQGFSIQAAFSSAYSGFNTSMLNLPEGTELSLSLSVW